MAKSPHIRRKLAAADKRVLADYTSLAGQVVWASNAMHAKFHLIFEQVMLFDCEHNRPVKRRVATAMWHSLPSDSAQRSMLSSAVSEAFTASHPLTKALEWALKVAGKLSEYRNDAVHTAFEFNNDTKRWRMVPNRWAGAPQRVDKLNRVGYKRLFKLLIGDLIQLRVYADVIWQKLAYPEPTTLPKRPVMRSSRLVQHTPPTSNKKK